MYGPTTTVKHFLTFAKEVNFYLCVCVFSVSRITEKVVAEF